MNISTFKVECTWTFPESPFCLMPSRFVLKEPVDTIICMCVLAKRKMSFLY